MNVLLYIFRVIVLCVPTGVEVYNDRHSDPNKKRDVYVRGILIIFCGMVDVAIADAVAGRILLDVRFFMDWSKAVLLSFAIFFFSFDYIMAKVYGKRVTFLGTTSDWDNAVASVHPWVLFAVKLVVLVAAILIYILW